MTALGLDAFVHEQRGCFDVSVIYGFAAVGDRLLVDDETRMPSPVLVYHSFPVRGTPLHDVVVQDTLIFAVARRSWSLIPSY